MMGADSGRQDMNRGNAHIRRGLRGSVHTEVDLRAHGQQPIDGLLQEDHVVVSGDAAEHLDLLREALRRNRNRRGGRPSTQGDEDHQHTRRG